MQSVMASLPLADDDEEGQAVQVSLPNDEKNPDGHTMQSDSSLFPSDDRYLPAPQSWHAETLFAPTVVDYLPEGQG